MPRKPSDRRYVVMFQLGSFPATWLHTGTRGKARLTTHRWEATTWRTERGAKMAAFRYRLERDSAHVGAVVLWHDGPERGVATV